jgi:signal transduction histidine kinase
MREISLHIMDVIENSIRAQASTIAVTIAADVKRDVLRIVIEDNGTGLKVSPEAALDPFYTTKRGKRTGLGLSLFRAAAEQAGGRLTLGDSELGGVAVTAEMELSHIDRNPVGDLAATLSTLVCTNPEIDFCFRLVLGGRECRIRVPELAKDMGAAAGDSIAVARKVMEKINAELEAAGVLT